MKKKYLIIPAAVCLIIILGWAAAETYLNSTAFRVWLVSRINTTIAGELTLSHHRISLLSGRLTLSGVRLVGPRGDPLVAVERLQVSVFWPALMQREIHIGILILDTVRVALHFDSEDRLKFLDALKGENQSDEPPSHAKPWNFQVDDFQLHDGQIDFQRPVQGLAARVQEIELAVSGNLMQRSGKLRLATGLVELQRAQAAYRLQRLRVAAAYDAQAARPFSLEVETPHSHLSAGGNVIWAGRSSQMDTEFELDLSLAEIQAWLPHDLGLFGRAKGRITINGGVSDPRVRVKLSIIDAGALQVPAGEVDLDLVMEQRRLTLSTLNSRGVWGKMALDGVLDLQPMFVRSLFEMTAGPETAVYSLNVQGSQLQPFQLTDVLPDLEGTWQTHAQIQGVGLSGPQARGKADIRIQGQGVSVRSTGKALDADVSAAVEWDGPLLEIRDSTAAIGGNQLQATGQIDLRNRRVDAAGRIGLEQITEVGDALGIRLPGGSAEIQWRCQGPLARPAVQAKLLGREIAMDQWVFGQLLAEVEMDAGGMVYLPRLVLENQGSFVQGSGSLALMASGGGLQDDPALALDLEMAHLQPSDFGLQIGLDASLKGRLRVSGSPGDPVADLTLDESPLGWQGIQLLAKGKSHWENGRLGISQLILSKGQSAVALQGSIQWRDPDSGRWRASPLVRAELKADEMQLDDFFSDYKGRITAQASVSGDLNDPRGTFTLEGHDLDLSAQAVDRVRIEGRLSDSRLSVDRLTIDLVPGQTVKGSGWYAFDQQMALTLDGRGIDLKHIRALQGAYPVAGSLDLHVDGKGSIQRPHMAADLVVHNPQLNEQQWDDFHFQARLIERRLDLDADLNFDLKASARLDSGDFDLEADFDRTDLTPYLSLLGRPQNAGRLSGRVKAVGNWHAPLDIQGQATLADTLLTDGKRELIKIDKLDIRLDNGFVELPATRLNLLTDGHLTLAASGELRKDLSIRADGRLPMTALVPFNDTFRGAKGALELHAQAQGPWNRMQWQADATLAEISMVVPGLSQTVQNLNGRMRFNPQTLSVEAVSGEIDSGRFSLDGEIQLTDLKPSKGTLSVKADALPLQWPDHMDLKLNGDLQLQGSPERALLQGELVVLEGTYYKDVRLNLLSAVTQPRRAQPVPSSYSPPQWLAGIDLDILVGHRYPFLVDNNLVRLEVAPDLKITGTAALPLINGRARVTEGEVIFRRKTFTVKRGVVDFFNPNKTEPNLDIVAETSIRQWLITLSLSGTPEQLAFELSSDPAEAENDILSLILFGRTNAELAGNQGGGQTTQQMLASLLATAWGEDIKKTTGVDILEVETGSQSADDSQDRIEVTVGKRLSQRLTVKYALESSEGEVIQKAVSEYRFLEHLLASGFQDTKGRYGGEMLFRIEF